MPLSSYKKNLTVETYETASVEVTKNGRSRMLNRGLNPCHVCNENKVNIPLTGEVDVDAHFFDGRLTCDDCQVLLTENFIPGQKLVCSNLACRRKWKLANPRIMMNYCPCCRKLLETRLGECTWGTHSPKGNGEEEDWSETTLNLQYMQRLNKHIASIFSALGSHLKGNRGAKTSFDALDFEGELSLEQLLDQQRAIVSKSTVDPELCRNMNSVLTRKRQFFGVVEWVDPSGSGVCKLQALKETNAQYEEKKDKTALLKNEDLQLFVIDWKSELEVGQEVNFLAFVNPVNEEVEDCLQYILKLLPSQEQQQQKSTPNSPTAVSQNSESSGSIKSISPQVEKTAPVTRLQQLKNAKGLTICTSATPDEFPQKTMSLPGQRLKFAEEFQRQHKSLCQLSPRSLRVSQMTRSLDSTWSSEPMWLQEEINEKGQVEFVSSPKSSTNQQRSKKLFHDDLLTPTTRATPSSSVMQRRSNFSKDTSIDIDFEPSYVFTLPTPSMISGYSPMLFHGNTTVEEMEPYFQYEQLHSPRGASTFGSTNKKLPTMEI